MKRLKLASFTIGLLALAGSASAGVLYSNGPVNGTVTGWFIDVYSGYTVSDSFTPSGNSMTGFDMDEWVVAGSTPIAFDWSVGSTEFGNNLGSGVATIGGDATATLVCSNGASFNGGTCSASDGYDIYSVSVSTSPITVGGTDWLTLGGATDTSGARDAWDQNSGPSTAGDSSAGVIPSEAFDITGGTAAAPEPGSLLLMGTGIFLGLAGFRRRKAVR